jgi:hypothetical protein
MAAMLAYRMMNRVTDSHLIGKMIGFGQWEWVVGWIVSLFSIPAGLLLTDSLSPMLLIPF